MLSFEWRELEALCDRISDLRHRYAAAQRTKHAGLIDALNAEIAKARRQRAHLVHHISARLGSAAAERRHPTEASRQDAEPRHEAGADKEPLPFL